MRAMRLDGPGPIESGPLKLVEAPDPQAGPGDLIVRVSVCGVCHTDLHVAEGDMPLPKLPIIPGHQVVGRVAAVGAEVSKIAVGDRVGVAWLNETCGVCRYCADGKENLCEEAKFTGFSVDGGFADLIRVPADFVYQLPESYSSEEAAPLLCAGIVGYRSLKRSAVPPGGRLGIYGFGASAHLVMQVALDWGCQVSVFTRAEKHQALAHQLGASWVGRAEDAAPRSLDSAIIFAPAGALVPMALRALDNGGTLALAAVTMTPIPQMDYAPLYHERTITSVANATREDGKEFLEIAGKKQLKTFTQSFPLEEANAVLRMLKDSEIEASAVLRVS